MLAAAARVEFAFGALDYERALIIDVIAKNIQKPERFRLAFGDSDHIHAERRGKVCGFEKLF